MRVLHVGSTLEVSGGIESFIMNMYRCMKKNNVVFDFLVAEEKKNGFYRKEIIDRGGNIYTITKEGVSILNFIKKYNIYRNYREEIVHIHTNCGSRVFDGILAKIAGVKNIIFHCHTCKGEAPLKFRLLQPIFRLVGDYFWACSKEAATFFFGKKFAENEMYTLIHNAIDLDKYIYNENTRQHLREKNEWNKKFVLGFVGRLSIEKNIPFVLKIYQELKVINPESLLVIIGDGEESDNIKKMIKEMGMEKDIQMLGNKTNVRDYLSAFDCLILPSFFEGLGIVLIEAQATSLPCIASNNIPKETDVSPLISYLSLQNSAKDWAEAIERINVDRSISYKEQIKDKGYCNNQESMRILELYSTYMNKSKEVI